MARGSRPGDELRGGSLRRLHRPRVSPTDRDEITLSNGTPCGQCGRAVYRRVVANFLRLTACVLSFARSDGSILVIPRAFHSLSTGCLTVWICPVHRLSQTCPPSELSCGLGLPTVFAQVLLTETVIPVRFPVAAGPGRHAIATSERHPALSGCRPVPQSTSH
jgi:hypothetical protein